MVRGGKRRPDISCHSHGSSPDGDAILADAQRAADLAIGRLHHVASKAKMNTHGQTKWGGNHSNPQGRKYISLQVARCFCYERRSPPASYRLRHRQAGVADIDVKGLYFRF
jgi:hypothetical protein